MRARPARAMTGPATAQMVVPDMKLPPMTPTPWRAKTTPATVMRDPATASRIRGGTSVRGCSRQDACHRAPQLAGEPGGRAGDERRGDQRRARLQRGQHVRVLEAVAGGRVDQRVKRAAVGLLLSEDPDGLGLHAAWLEGHRGASAWRARGAQAQAAERGAGGVIDLVHEQAAVEFVQPAGQEARTVEVAYRAQGVDAEVLALAGTAGLGQGERLAGLPDGVRRVEHEGRSGRAAVEVRTGSTALGRGRVRGQGPGRADTSHDGQRCGRRDELALDGHTGPPDVAT